MYEVPLTFQKNIGVLEVADMEKLQQVKVAIIGLGGIGGNLAHHLVRLGVKNLILIDYDRFETTNLNRQLYSNHYNIGKYKAKIIKDEMIKIVPTLNIHICMKKVQEIEPESLEDVDYVMDAVDNIETKKYIEKLGTIINKPILHGACGGWYAQVGWIMPNTNILESMYGEGKSGIEKELNNPSFTPGVTAAFMAAEFVKMIKNDPSTAINKIQFIDLFNTMIDTPVKG